MMMVVAMVVQQNAVERYGYHPPFHSINRVAKQSEKFIADGAVCSTSSDPRAVNVALYPSLRTHCGGLQLRLQPADPTSLRGEG